MARPQEEKDKIRNGYIFDQLPLDMVAMRVGVPYDTARRWKMQAAKAGDDWEKLRATYTLAGNGLENIARTVLVSLVVKCQATMDQLNNNPDVPPKEAVLLLASLADSLSKAVSSSKKILPETDRLATALEVVQMLGVYISEKHPGLNTSFLDVLEGFARVLESDFK